MDEKCGKYKDDGCNRNLQMAGLAYPRTCQTCGLGPCIYSTIENPINTPTPLGKGSKDNQINPSKLQSKTSIRQELVDRAKKLQEIINATKFEHMGTSRQEGPIGAWIINSEQRIRAAEHLAVIVLLLEKGDF